MEDPLEGLCKTCFLADKIQDRVVEQMPGQVRYRPMEISEIEISSAFFVTDRDPVAFEVIA